MAEAYGLMMWYSDAHLLDSPHRIQREQERMLEAATEDASVRAKLIQALASLRQRLRATQRHVAMLMGTQQSAVSDLEKGLTDPRLSTIQRYARSIGYRVNIEIVEDVPDPQGAVARTLIWSSSWRHTNAPATRSNTPRLSVDDSARRPWMFLLEDHSLAQLGDEELRVRLRSLNPEEQPELQMQIASARVAS